MTKRKSRELNTVSVACILLSGMLALSACVLKENAPEVKETEPEAGFVLTGPEAYDSEDQAIIVSINTDEKKIKLYNREVDKNYTLNYDGTTKFLSKGGTATTLLSLSPGEVVDVKFLSGTKHLTELKGSSLIWVYEEVSGVTVDQVKSEISFGDQVFKITSKTRFFSEDGSISASDTDYLDVMNIYGYDTEVYSVQIKSGHGVIVLKNEDYFIGGWIEIGRSVIKEIAADMSIVVPEGEFEIKVSQGKTSSSKKVTIHSGEEYIYDLGEIEILEPSYGNITFNISPEGANLYIDEKLTNYDRPVRLEYGLHRMDIAAKGYDSVSKILKVGSEEAEIEITLELTASPTPTPSSSPSPSPSASPSPSPSVSPSPNPSESESPSPSPSVSPTP